ncbi:hypothetical protein ABGB18_13655 [Nonomuraea sp. B12E4]|uniref:hypothetical protein n=1 Tax=Nonomuraea sp. B12E4 TaxID=3153564 RepID=UPI00325E3AF7
MGDFTYEGMSYTELDGPRWEPCRSDGEVQTFLDYHQRVAVARSCSPSRAPPPTPPGSGP